MTMDVLTLPRTFGAEAVAGRRLAVAHIGVAVAAFGVAAAMAIMQALSRANLELPFRSASMYYMSVTAMIFLVVATIVMHFFGPANFHVHATDWTVIARCALIGLTATLAQWLIFRQKCEGQERRSFAPAPASIAGVILNGSPAFAAPARLSEQESQEPDSPLRTWTPGTSCRITDNPIP